MEKAVAVSVVVPVYNGEKYIKNCAEAVKRQTFSDWELILVNDGSTDKSEEICNEVVHSHERITCIHTLNGGAAAARNAGVNSSKGKYIAFIDVDDEVTEDYLQKLYELAEGFEADIAIGGRQDIYEKDSIMFKADKLRKVAGETVTEFSEEMTSHSGGLAGYETGCFSGVYAMEQLLYQKKFLSVPWGCLIKKELIMKFPFPEGKRVEDFATMYKLYGNAKKVVYTDEPLYKYYQRKGSTIYNAENALKKNRDYYSHSIEMIKYVKANFPSYIEAAYSRHFSTCFQILSETDLNKKSEKLINQVYKDVRNLQNKMLTMKKVRLLGRGAAVVSLVDVRVIHFILRIYYRIKMFSL